MLYKHINLLPFNKNGMLYGGNAKKLSEFILTRNIKTIIEVGSWIGISAIHMAQLLPADGKLFAVDTWEGSIEHIDCPVWASYLPTLYQQFLSNVVHENLQSKIVPIKLNSQDASKLLAAKADLIYIDAAHDGDSVYNDIKAWYPFLNKDGIICGDDFTWKQFPGVVVAVNMFAEENNLKVNTYKRFWWYSSK